MKKRTLGTVICACLLVLSVSAFAQKPGNTNEEDFFGPAGPGPNGPAPVDMMEERFDRPFMGGYGMMGGLFDQEMENIAEAYKIKIEKVFLEAKESRLGLNSKRRALYAKLKELADRYPQDKSVSKAIVATIKELNGIQRKVQEINEKAMDKIGALNREREKELQTANENWIRKIESDNKELEKYLEFLNARKHVPQMNQRNINKNRPPKDR